MYEFRKAFPEGGRLGIEVSQADLRELVLSATVPDHKLRRLFYAIALEGLYRRTGGGVPRKSWARVLGLR